MRRTVMCMTPPGMRNSYTLRHDYWHNWQINKFTASTSWTNCLCLWNL